MGYLQTKLALLVFLFVSNEALATEKLDPEAVESAFRSYLTSEYDQRLVFFSQGALVSIFSPAYLVSGDKRKLKALSTASDHLNAIDKYKVQEFKVSVNGERVVVEVNALGKQSRNSYSMSYIYVTGLKGQPKIDKVKVNRSEK